MIVLDTSAIVAIIAKEPERDQFLAVIEAADTCCISARSLYETQLVVFARLGSAGLDETSMLLAQFVVSVAAYRQFGKGFHAATALNLRDCAAYALGSPLLFKGDDFRATDIVPAA